MDGDMFVSAGSCVVTRTEAMRYCYPSKNGRTTFSNEAEAKELRVLEEYLREEIYCFTLNKYHEN
jgi:hypothetical protein